MQPGDQAAEKAEQLVAALHANFRQLAGNLLQMTGNQRNPQSLVTAYENWFRQFGEDPIEIAWAFSCDREALAACQGLLDTQISDLDADSEPD